MPSRPTNAKPAYLDSVFIAIAIIVVVEGEINHLLRTGDGLPGGRGRRRRRNQTFLPSQS